MVYICDNCGARFSRSNEQDHCPSCGRALIHLANPVEQHEYAAYMAEQLCVGGVDRLRFPNIVETELSIPDSFAFKLPVTALQIDSSMALDITVEFGENADDPDDLTANVWVKRADGRFAEFLMPLHLPWKPGESKREQIDRIFSALSGNGAFTAKLCGFALKQLASGADSNGGQG